MLPSELVLQTLERFPGPPPVVLVDDFYDLVELPNSVILQRSEDSLFALSPPHRVLVARGNLGFRLAYEPLREEPGPLIIVRKGPDLFLPDVETRLQAPQHHLRITPQWLLQQATGDEGWPPAVDNFFLLLPQQWTAWQQAHTRFRQHRPQGFTDGDLQDLILSAWLDLDLWGNPSPATVWQRFFATTEEQEEIQGSFPHLHRRWLEWLARQPPPIHWLREDHPASIRNLLWWVRLLAPHSEDPILLLAQVYPGVRWREGLSLALVERFTTQLEQHAPKLVNDQLDLAEEAWVPSVLRGLWAQLGCDQVVGARDLALRESHSPRLLIAALRTVINHLAQHPEEALHAEWVSFCTQLRESSLLLHHRRNGPALTKHVRLLTALIEMHRTQHRIKTQLPQLSKAPSAHRTRILISTYIDSQGFALAPAIENLQALLLDDDINDPRYHPQEDQEAMRRLTLQLWEQGQAGTHLRESLEEAFVRAVAQSYPHWAMDPGVPLLTRFWRRHFHPLWQERGEPDVALFFCHGLRWDLWEQVLRPRLEQDYVVRMQTFLASLPALPNFSLRRWLAGEEWQPSDASADLPELAHRSVPQRVFSLARWPHPADIEEGIIDHHLTAEGMMITEVSFLTSTGQLRPEVAEALTDVRAGERLAARFQALLASVLPKALIFLVAGSGFAAAKQPLPWPLPPPTRMLSSRCVVVATEGFPAPAIGFAAQELSLSLQALWGADSIPGDLPPPTVLLAPGDHYFTPDPTSPSPPPYPQAGGLSLGELVVPCALLLPPRTESGVRVELSSPIAAEEYQEGQPGEISLVLHLRSGALAEVAVISCDAPASKPVTVGLEIGTRKPVRLRFVPHLEPGPESWVELPVRITVQVAGEEQQRIARIRVRRKRG